ncbi:MAG: Rnase Y domain-containing protein, partial [Actinomycetota bacterium]|nr:Rnase Y domain-containing protein [Actinomycetota bacterium]
MPETTLVVLVGAIAAIAGAVVGYLARRVLAANSVRHADSYAGRIVAEARAKQKEIVLEGKDDALKIQRAAEDEAREKRADLQRQERLLLDRSESMDRKLEAFERREEGLEERLRLLEAERAQVAELQQRQLGELERVGGLSAGEARQTLIGKIVDEAQAEAQQQVREVERRAHDEGEDLARRVLTTVMQRIAA